MRPTWRLAVNAALVSSTWGTVACSHDKIVIRVLGEDSSNLQAMKALAPKFEGEMRERGRNISVVFDSASFEDAREKADQDFERGSGKYDIVLQYNFSLADYASKRRVLTVKELTHLVPEGAPRTLESALFNNVWHEVGWYYVDDKDHSKGIMPVGYPFAANTMLLVYNQRFFDDPKIQKRYQAQFHSELRPPQSWTAFKNVAQALTDQSKSECGLALQGKDQGWLYYEWMNVLNGFGGSVMKKDYGWEGGPDTRLELDTPVAADAATYYASLKPYTCGDFFSVDAPMQRELILSDKVGMALMWSDYLFELATRARAKGIRLGFSPVPGSKSLIGGGAYYVNRAGSHPDIAAQFVMFLLREDNQVELTRKGLASPVRAVYQNPLVDSVPYIDALGTSLERASYMLEAGPDADLISSRITEAMQRIWKGEQPTLVLSETQERLRKERAQLFAKRIH